MLKMMMMVMILKNNLSKINSGLLSRLFQQFSIKKVSQVKGVANIIWSLLVMIIVTIAMIMMAIMMIAKEVNQE